MSRRSLAIAVLLTAVSACSRQAAPQPQQAAAPVALPARGVAEAPAAAYLPLPQVPFAPARPMDVVEVVFHFAADHPEVLSRIPCFCGCESRGHKHNDDCFVAARDERGRVTEWEPHGIG
jgi:hypothetical protein